MIKLAMLVLCLVGSMAMVLDKPHYDPDNAEDLFRQFVKEYGKSYTGKEYLERLEIFKESLKEINHLNAKHPETVFAVNHFADLRPEELEQYFGFMPLNETRVKMALPDSGVTAPPTLDWRDRDAVTHVRNLGGYPFQIMSTIGNIEGQYAIKHKQCIAFSDQQALDCLECESGACRTMHQVMQGFANRAGVMSEKDYPLIYWKGQCHEDSRKVIAHVLDGQQMYIPDEDILMEKLAEIGPLSVGLVADVIFAMYQGGILHPTPTCTNGNLTHGLLLVGYGEDNGTKYWILKNSWGVNWGEKGYVRLLRGVNACRMGTGYTANAVVA